MTGIANPYSSFILNDFLNFSCIYRAAAALDKIYQSLLHTHRTISAISRLLIATLKKIEETVGIVNKERDPCNLCVCVGGGCCFFAVFQFPVDRKSIWG